MAFDPEQFWSTLRGYAESQPAQGPVVKPEPMQLHSMDPNLVKREQFSSEDNFEKAKLLMHSMGKYSDAELGQQKEQKAAWDKAREGLSPYEKVMQGVATQEEAKAEAGRWQEEREYTDQLFRQSPMTTNLRDFAYGLGQAGAHMLPGVGKEDVMDGLSPDSRARIEHGAHGRLGQASGMLMGYGAGMGATARVLQPLAQVTRLSKLAQGASKMEKGLRYLATNAGPGAAFEAARTIFDEDQELTAGNVLRNSAFVGAMGAIAPAAAPITRTLRKVFGKGLGGVKNQQLGNALISGAMYSPQLLSGEMSVRDFVREMKEGGFIDAMYGALTKKPMFAKKGLLADRRVEVNEAELTKTLEKSGLPAVLESIRHAQDGASMSPVDQANLLKKLKDAGHEDVARAYKEDVLASKVSPKHDPNLQVEIEPSYEAPSSMPEGPLSARDAVTAASSVGRYMKRGGEGPRSITSQIAEKLQARDQQRQIMGQVQGAGGRVAGAVEAPIRNIESLAQQNPGALREALGVLSGGRFEAPEVRPDPRVDEIVAQRTEKPAEKAQPLPKKTEEMPTEVKAPKLENPEAAFDQLPLEKLPKPDQEELKTRYRAYQAAMKKGDPELQRKAKVVLGEYVSSAAQQLGVELKDAPAPKPAEAGKITLPEVSTPKWVKDAPKAVGDFVRGMIEGTTTTFIPERVQDKFAKDSGGFFKRLQDKRYTKDFLADDDAVMFYHALSNKAGGIRVDKKGNYMMGDVVTARQQADADINSWQANFLDPHEVLDPRLPRSHWRATQDVINWKEQMSDRFYKKESGSFWKLRKEHGSVNPSKRGMFGKGYKKGLDEAAYNKSLERVFEAAEKRDPAGLKGAELAVYRDAVKTFDEFKKLFREHYGKQDDESWGIENYVTHVVEKQSRKGMKGRLPAEVELRRQGFDYTKQRTGSEDFIKNIEVAINEYVPKAITKLRMDRWYNEAKDIVDGRWNLLRKGQLRSALERGTLTTRESERQRGTEIHLSVQKDGKTVYQESEVVSMNKDGATLLVDGVQKKLTWEKIDKMNVYARQAGKDGNSYYGLRQILLDKGLKRRQEAVEAWLKDVTNPRAVNKLTKITDNIVNLHYNAFLGNFSLRAGMTNSLQHLFTMGHVGVGYWGKASAALMSKAMGGNAAVSLSGGRKLTKDDITKAVGDILGNDKIFGIINDADSGEFNLVMDPAQKLTPWQSIEAMKVTTSFFFNKSEAMNRQVAGIAGYIKARERGMGHDDAVLQGQELIRRTQGQYVQASSPAAFRQGRNANLNALKRGGLMFMRWANLGTNWYYDNIRQVFQAGKKNTPPPEFAMNMERIPVPGTREFDAAPHSQRKSWTELLKQRLKSPERRQEYSDWYRKQDRTSAVRAAADPSIAIRTTILSLLAIEMAEEMLGQHWGTDMIFPTPLKAGGLAKGFSEGRTSFGDAAETIAPPVVQTLARAVDVINTFYLDSLHEEGSVKDIRKYDKLKKLVVGTTFGPALEKVFDYAVLTEKRDPNEPGAAEEPYSIYGVDKLFDPGAQRLYNTNASEILRRNTLPGETDRNAQARWERREQDLIRREFRLARETNERNMTAYLRAKSKGDTEGMKKAMDRMGKIAGSYGITPTAKGVMNLKKRAVMNRLSGNVLRGSTNERAAKMESLLKRMQEKPSLVPSSDVLMLMSELFGSKNIGRVPQKQLHSIVNLFESWQKEAGLASKKD